MTVNQLSSAQSVDVYEISSISAGALDILYCAHGDQDETSSNIKEAFDIIVKLLVLLCQTDLLLSSFREPIFMSAQKLRPHNHGNSSLFHFPTVYYILEVEGSVFLYCLASFYISSKSAQDVIVHLKMSKN